MAPEIQIKRIKDGDFQVRVKEAGSESQHLVTLSQKDYQRLSGGKVEPIELIKRSFEFLLAREPKESILSKFDLLLIGHYFPEFERELKRSI